MSINFLRKGGWTALVVLVAASGVYFLRGPLGSKGFQPLPASLVAAPVGDLPNMPHKPMPESFTFDGCPPQGKGGDAELNLLKNRVDKGKYVSISFDSLTTLTWPKSIERQPMQAWSDSNRNFITQYEGIPVSVEGYIVNLREGLPDPANCNWTNSSYLDWHLTFTNDPHMDRSQSVLVEVTPRVRFTHKWTIDLIHSVVMGDHLPVRISGWLYFDPEHPGDIGQTRATLWEINPVMQIEVFESSRWIPLDKLAD